MPLGDVSYQNAALDAVVASWPASGATYRLFNDDPAQADDLADVELASDGGYAPAVFAPSDFDAADAGSKATTAPVGFGVSTDAYSDAATYWAVVDGSGLIVYSAPLTAQIVVSGAGTVPAFTPTLSFQDEGA